MSIINTIKDFIDNTKSEASDKKFALGIATTSFCFEQPFFSFPRIIEGWGYYFHIVCPSSDHADEIIQGLKGYIDDFFLDVEHKKLEFDHAEIQGRNAEISFISIYPNEITIRSCFDILDTVNGTQALIFGHGDLAFRLASLMRKKNLAFSWIASRKSTSQKYLAMTKEFGNRECDYLGDQINILYNFSPKPSRFLAEAVNQSKIKIVDAASKGAFGSVPEGRVYSLDISARLVNEISFSLIGNRYSATYGRTTNNANVCFVSGGYPGELGDLVVDNYLLPSFLIGISNGSGGFLRRINKAFKDS